MITVNENPIVNKIYEHRYFLILSFLVFLSYCLSYNEVRNVTDDRGYITIDALEYLSIAENLANGNGYKITTGGTFESQKETSYRTPGYPFFILALRKIFGSEKYITAVILYQHFLLGFLPLLFYFLTFLIIKERKYAVLSAIISLLFFPFRYLADIIHPDFLAFFLLLLSLCFLLANFKKENILKILLFSFFLASAIMIKQNLISLILLFIFPLPKLLKRKAYILSLIFPFLFISTWVARNYFVHHKFPVYVTNGGFNFYMANNPDLKPDLSNITKFSYVMKKLIKDGLSEIEADRELYRMGLSNMKKNGFLWQVKRILEKIQVTFRDYYPLAKNGIFFLLLPFVLVMPGKKYPLLFLILYQVIHGIITYHPHFSLHDFYHANLMDINSLNFIGLTALVLLLKRSKIHAKFFQRSAAAEAPPGDGGETGRKWLTTLPGKGIAMLAAVYLLILAPVLIFIPLDRLTIMTDFLLIITYSLSPLVFTEFYRKKNEMKKEVIAK